FINRLKIEISKVYRILKKCSKTELNRFQQFLESPYFNKREDLIILYQQLVTTRSKAIDAVQLYQKVAPKKIYKAQDLRLLLSYLYKHLECFLVCENFLKQEESFSNRLHEIEIFQQKKLSQYAQKNLQYAQKKLEKSNRRNADFFWERYQLLEKGFEFSSVQNPSGEHEFQKIAEALDVTFIAMKLRQSCQSLSHQTIYKYSFQDQLMVYLITYIEQHKLYQIPAIGIYYYIYLSLTNHENSIHFGQLQNRFYWYADQFPDKELRDIHLMLVNHCIKQINKGDFSFRYTLLNLYQHGLKNGYIIEKGMLSRFTYTNIVKIGIRCGELEWVQQFVEDFKENLEKQYRESTYHINLASIAYATKEYDQALFYLQRYNFKNVILNLTAKVLQMKIFYELEEREVLESHLKAMETFIRRKEVLGYHRENYSNILKFTNQLNTINIYDADALRELQSKIERAVVLTEKNWLLEQIEVLLR
ncbi:MAG: hypothetical protein AAF849_19785, partial [Bacteroidota bacterium]